MEDSNVNVDLYSMLTDFERNITEGSKSTMTDKKRKREITIEPTTFHQMNDNQSIQLVDSCGDFITSEMVLQDAMNDALEEKKQKVDFHIDSPFIDMLRKINKLRISKRNMTIEIEDMKKEINELKELVSSLKDKLDTMNSTKKYKKNSVMGQLEIIKELIINTQK